jgi:hypothetical protein
MNDYIDFNLPKFSFVKLSLCDICGSQNHTTNDHIISRIERYNIDISHSPICSKCFGEDHPRKYCDIYNECIKNDNGYFKYLDKVYHAEKKSRMLDYCKYSAKSIEFLNDFPMFSLDEQILFLYNHDHFPAEGLKPFWDIVYKQHPKQLIESVKIKYYD